MRTFLFAWLLCSSSVAFAESIVEGTRKAWHPLTISFDGPEASSSQSSPNPFLDYRLQVRFTGPSKQVYNVAGFFDGNGKGELAGHTWKVRFSPDQPGEWTYQASLRSGPEVAVSLDEEIGTAVPLGGSSGAFNVSPLDPNSPGYLKYGRLNYVGKHYLKFQDGPYWLRGGTDEPEDFLGYAGFVRTTPKHRYPDHVADWREGDPDWGDGQGRGITGALNYLADQHVNSIYFLTMNIGGDGKNVWPWLGTINPKGDPSNDNLHYDVEKLNQWETVFLHAQRNGLFLHVVFNEAERANKMELDNGELGVERKLYYRELIARFGHHLAMEWNLCEEYNLDFDLGPERIRQYADYILALDPYKHPIAVHNVGDPVKVFEVIYGDPRFSMTSIQLNQRPIHEVTEGVRRGTIDAGRPIPISLDEFTLDRGQRASHLPVDDAEGHRREKIWPTYLSGGNIEFILGDLLKTDSFKTPERQKLWQYLWFARKFMEAELPFWEMDPNDNLAAGASTFAMGIGKGKTVPLGPQVFAKEGTVYAVYYPVADLTGTLDLSMLIGPATKRWYNPRTGEFVGNSISITGGANHVVGEPPADKQSDWVLLIRKDAESKTSSIDTSGFRDSAGHWRHIRDEMRFIKVEPNQPEYSANQVDEIAANILLFQRKNGGWPKDYDMLAVLTAPQRQAVIETHERNDTSFDNHNTHSQVKYLAQAYSQTKNESYRDACEKGFDFMLQSQYPNGGFPQKFPSAKNYSAHITFNDGVMIGILEVFKDAVDGEPQWSWLDDARRQSAGRAIDRAIECILKCQIEVNGVRTGWCQQHDEKTYEAASARSFELASICPQDTTEILRFLMRIEQPTPEVVDSIERAVVWMKSVELKGIRLERVKGSKEEFIRHSADFDLVVMEDPNAKPIWARHYEIGTGRPIFAGRDGVKKYSFAEIERERRTGTAWYGGWPSKLIEREYPHWCEQHKVATN